MLISLRIGITHRRRFLPGNTCSVGRPRILSHDESVEALLRDLVQYHEGTGPDTWMIDAVSAQTLTALKQAIVCFEMPLSHLKGRVKLDQNRPREDILDLGIALKKWTPNRRFASQLGRTRIGLWLSRPNSGAINSNPRKE